MKAQKIAANANCYSEILKEKNMFNVTEAAQSEVAEYFKENELKPIRVFLHQGCGGPQIALAVDEKRDDDSIYEFAGVEYVIEKDFLNHAQPIEVDFQAMAGFTVTSNLQLSPGGGCGGCGSSDSCCS